MESTPVIGAVKVVVSTGTFISMQIMCGVIVAAHSESLEQEEEEDEEALEASMRFHVS